MSWLHVSAPNHSYEDGITTLTWPHGTSFLEPSIYLLLAEYFRDYAFDRGMRELSSHNLSCLQLGRLTLFLGKRGDGTGTESRTLLRRVACK